MEREWVRSVRDQCKTLAWRFFFKQWEACGQRQAGGNLMGGSGANFRSHPRRIRSRRNKSGLWSPSGLCGARTAYVKHVFLERYLEALIFKTATGYNHIVYVDGFAGHGRVPASGSRTRRSGLP